MAAQSLTPAICAICKQNHMRPFRLVHRHYAGKDYVMRLSQCENCTFVSIPEEIPVTYDLEYLQLECSDDPALARFRAEERITHIKQRVPPDNSRKFLDIGIGDGLLLSIAERQGYLTFGLDINPDGFRLAQQRYGLRAQMSFESFDNAFPSVLFDVIHMNEVIEHISDPIRLLEWCRRHLTADGSIFIQTGNVTSLASRLKGNNWDYFRPVHVSYFSTKSMKLALTRAGLRLCELRSADWRASKVLQTLRHLNRTGQRVALRFLITYLTTFVYGINRTMLIRATRVQ